MSLEDLTGTGKGIDSLVITNPDGLDPKSEGDNHIRGIKNVLVNVFGAMVAAAASLPAVGDVLRWDGAKYAPAGGGAAGLLPAGTILDFGGVAVPTGFLRCDGTPVSRASFAALFAAIGTTWGVGDGATTFNVPNLARRATVGAGGAGTGTLGNAVGNTGGAETHTLIANELALHSHGMAATPNSFLTWGAGDLGTFTVAPGAGVFGRQSVTSTGGGGNDPHNNVQPSAVMLKIIKT